MASLCNADCSVSLKNSEESKKQSENWIFVMQISNSSYRSSSRYNQHGKYASSGSIGKCSCESTYERPRVLVIQTVVISLLTTQLLYCAKELLRSLK